MSSEDPAENASAAAKADRDLEVVRQPQPQPLPPQGNDLEEPPSYEACVTKANDEPTGKFQHLIALIIHKCDLNFIEIYVL